MKSICLATNNAHKVVELQQLLGNSFSIQTLEQIGCFDDIEETGQTFEENSAIKANFVFDKYGLDCIADDSGLEIDALNGEPGVISARYAGVHGDHAANIAKVLTKMTGISNRRAQFRTYISAIINGQLVQFEGIVQGQLTNKPVGNGGFGYDPIFIPDGYDKTFAQLSSQIKNQISHRAMAIAKLLQFLNSK